MFHFLGLHWDDIVYLILLFGSIGFGSFFRSIKNPKDRQNISSLIGFIIVIIVSGRHTVYPLICTLINALIIKCLDRKIVHKVSFVFSFTFLILFRSVEYFGLPAYPNPTNLVMMIMTLKMVGLAFEVNDVYKHQNNLKDNKSQETRLIEIPSFIDIFHYGYSYLGVLAGPYYTYRTYCDLFTAPFWKYANCESVALERFKYLPLYGVIFLVLSYYYPFSEVEDIEYFNERSLWYRLWFSFPSFAQFRMRMYIGMRLAEIVIIMGGLGAYPEFCKPATLGPTTNLRQLTELSNDEEKASKEKYNFVAIYSIEPYHTEFETTVRASMKYWNMSVQCWLTSYIYLRSSKAYRTLFTFVVSAVWHGTSPGYFFSFVSVALFLPIEDIYRRKSKQMEVPSFVSYGMFNMFAIQ
ncbi:unnamed protein product [Nezara viridula]|uniref:Lysophospholipid acyltransferase 7 n=1 Tax=Nezara viridula TaxID=85310 RepID=A0A9P0H5S5_NEZVI|nr:unnamed protein product [Nezara viridula]